MLDGEIIAFSEEKKLSFFDLQKRLGRRDQADLFLPSAITVCYVVFDVLWRNGVSLMKGSLAERRVFPIVTPVGGMPTAIEHLENGALLDNHSEEAVINSAIEILQRLSKDGALRHKLSANIRTTFEQDFSKNRFNAFIRNYFSLAS
jgi:glycosyltransferase involved in cell wall biosynthesis